MVFVYTQPDNGNAKTISKNANFESINRAFPVCNSAETCINFTIGLLNKQTLGCFRTNERSDLTANLIATDPHFQTRF